MSRKPLDNKHDVVLIGGGIMSATLGVMLKELEPSLRIAVFERLEAVAGESSDAWNNAGTGHSAFCELNYTPEKEDGSIDISKAVKVAESFEVSKQFWSYLVGKGYIRDARTFINSIPHMSFVWGEENVAYLKKRHAAMTKHPLFRGMEYSDDHRQLAAWMPLVMKDRDPSQKVSATHMEAGTDVNFGNLTRSLFAHLQQLDGVDVYFNTEARHIEKNDRGHWLVEVKGLEDHDKQEFEAPFVFIGAGGGALTLLEKTHIPEAKGFGGFPVSGQWLVCHKEDVIEQHAAKVYGKAGVGAPPMSVPHLDTRMIDGKKALLFGPYAGFSTKFLKHGSLMDLPASIRWSNIRPMLSAGIHNLDLTKYLIEQVRLSPEDRMEELKEFVPTARIEDWDLKVAGQRVQVIKHDDEEGGVLEFGTEIVNAEDGSVAALLGASPGASTSVSIMLDVLKRCFKNNMHSPAWEQKLKEMIPTYGQSLATNESLCISTRRRTSEALGLKTVAKAV